MNKIEQIMQALGSESTEDDVKEFVAYCDAHGIDTIALIEGGYETEAAFYAVVDACFNN